jgi:hypothetical protein
LKIASILIHKETMVDIVCQRRFCGDVFVWYADQASHGRGNLMDSDMSDPFFAYEYEEGSGDDSSVNIPELVGKPYDMRNRAIAFVLPAPWER